VLIGWNKTRKIKKARKKEVVGKSKKARKKET
jgi:hypothetical protein